MLLLPSQAAPWLKVAKRQGVASFLPFLEAGALEITQSLGWGMKIILLAWLNAWGDVLTAGCHFSTNNRQFFFSKVPLDMGLLHFSRSCQVTLCCFSRYFFQRAELQPVLQPPCSFLKLQLWGCSPAPRDTEGVVLVGGGRRWLSEPCTRTE